MRCPITGFIFLFGVLAVVGLQAADLPGGNSNSPDDVLNQALVVNRDLYVSLRSFVCHERMDRFRGRRSAAKGRAVDTVTAKVSLENGTEQYSELLQKNRPLPDLAQLGGAWSEGEFGTLLRQTEQLLGTSSPYLVGESDVDGVAAFLYRFDVSAGQSPWDLTVSGQHYVIPFTTRVWIAKDSRIILKIARSSTEIPASLYIAEINWGVTLGPVSLNGKQWLLPSRGSYEVSYRYTDRREWNTMQFSDYHRYGSETAIRFQ